MRASLRSTVGLAGGLLALGRLAVAWRLGRGARRTERWLPGQAPASWPTVSVIVPAWSDRQHLLSCLAGLERVEYGGGWEVIVVAGGPDGTLEVARDYALTDPEGIRVLEQRSEGGKNGAMNDGTRAARGEIFVFVDADTVVTPGWLSAMVTPLENGYAASTGKFLVSRPTLVSASFEMSQVLEYEARGRVILQGSGTMALRREAFESLGGLPEGAPYADDWDMTERLCAADRQLAFVPEALSCTERPATLGEWWQNELRWRRIHLMSVFRVRNVVLSDPFSAAKALYPYAAAWSALLATAVLLLSFAGHARRRETVKALWFMLVGPIMVRELAGPVRTAAYTGDWKWMRVLLVTPVLTVMGWAANAVASLTASKAGVHYKGPRGAADRTRPAGAVDDNRQATTIEDVLIGAVR